MQNKENKALVREVQLPRGSVKQHLFEQATYCCSLSHPHNANIELASIQECIRHENLNKHAFFSLHHIIHVWLTDFTSVLTTTDHLYILS